jgi:hypothetical protein
MNGGRQSSAKIFISSANSTQWTNSSSNTRIKVPITPFILTNNDPSHFVLGVESLSFPVAMNVVGSANNTLQLGGVTYTIPSGNYTATNLVTALGLLSIDNGVTTTTTLGFTFAFSSTTNKLTITKTGGVVIGALTTCQTILGISAGTYTSPHTPDGLVNLTSTSGIIIRILNIQNENRDNQSTSGSTTLARIPINTSQFRILQFYNSQPFYTSISNRSITELDIQLCGDDYQQLNLTGNPNWFLTLRIDFADTRQTNIPRTMIQTARDNLIPEEIKPTLQRK